MIKINLLKRKKAGGGGPNKLFGIDLGGVKGLDTSALRDFDFKRSPFVRIAISLAVIYGADLWIQGQKLERLSEEDGRINAQQAEIDEVSKKLGKVKGFEPLKKQLEDDERNIQTKLDLINSLLENREAPAQLMRQISQIIPEEVWLDTLSVKDGTLKISGGATSYNIVTDFMKGLGESTLFSGVNLSQVNESSKDGVKFQQFDISAQTKGI